VSVQEKLIPNFGRVGEKLLHREVILADCCFGIKYYIDIFPFVWLWILFWWIRGFRELCLSFLFWYTESYKVTVLLQMHSVSRTGFDISTTRLCLFFFWVGLIRVSLEQNGASDTVSFFSSYTLVVCS
jgi:hypothetical protein